MTVSDELEAADGKPGTDEGRKEEGPEPENFSELLKFTFAGYLAGLGLGALLDYYGLQLSALGGWLVRTLAGEGESIFEGFYIPFFYANSDQIGANISGLIYIKRREKSWGPALRKYFRHPVMVTSLLTIIMVPIGLFLARSAGFRPTTQVLAAFETIAANLCWLPPLVGAYFERRRN